ncbi:MAG: ABC transporter permease [Oscillospiraceae bacterium]|nr:ABC transporter permease [Oscillospiraceae bacterium]
MRKRSNLINSSYIGIIMTFLYAPIAVLIVFSFNSSKSRALWTGFTLDWYKKMFTNEVILSSLMNTLIIAIISAVFATIIGTLAAIGIHAMTKWMQTLILNITYMPIINPEIVTGVSLMLLFVFVRDKMNVPMEMGFITLILAHITFSIPYIILNVMPKLRQMDKNIYDAALDLGCDPVNAFIKVVIPEIMPGIIAGFLMAFTFSLDDFIISYFVSGPNFTTLPITIYAMTRKKVSPEINALSTIVFLVVLVTLAVYNVFDARRDNSKRY